MSSQSENKNIQQVVLDEIETDFDYKNYNDVIILS